MTPIARMLRFSKAFGLLSQLEACFVLRHGYAVSAYPRVASDVAFTLFYFHEQDTKLDMLLCVA
jgi:hypothetical protein